MKRRAPPDPNDVEARTRAMLEVERKKRETRCLETINRALAVENCRVEASAVISFDGTAPRLLWTVKALP